MLRTVTKYGELDAYLRSFKRGTLNLLVIIGPNGQGKSRNVARVLGKDKKNSPIWIRGGAISAYELYHKLYERLDEDIVLDDCDSLYGDRTSVRLLKAICETEDVKKVAWNTRNREMEAMGVPKEFATRSRFVVILNQWHTINSQVVALEDRGLLVQFEPSFDEVLANGKRWFKDREVISYVEKQKDYIETLSLRSMVVASKLRQDGLPWREALDETLKIDELKLIDSLMSDAAYLTNDARLDEFRRRTRRRGREEGLSRRTFYNRVAKVAELKGAGKPAPLRFEGGR